MSGGAAGSGASGSGADDPAQTAGSGGADAVQPQAGTSGTMPVAGSGAAGTMAAAGSGGSDMMPPAGIPFAMDECPELNSGFPGDEYCIKPPPPGQGFQLHIGPRDYNNPEPIYVLEPGEEVTNNLSAPSGNDQDIYFYFRQFRMRPGSHHMIITAGGSGGEFDLTGRRIGTANSSIDSPAGGIIAPENEDVGVPLSARTTINVSLHSINTTSQPIIRELWVNFWYRDAALVKETAEQLFQTGDVTFAIAPGQDTILGPYSCTIQNAGRMLWFYGHRHANNKRFSAWRVRGGQRDLFYEGLHWEEPMVLEYSSTVTNPKPDRAAGIEGGWSGILDLMPGDRLEWECHVVNMLDTTLRFSNNTYTGEMCIMDAELVGTNCSAGRGFPGF